MDSKDLEAEIHPLKNEDKKLPANVGNPAKTEESSKGSPRQPHLSRCRTVAFFLSLFVCLFVVFVVSFIIPCPDRPASQGVWRVNYNAAGVFRCLGGIMTETRPHVAADGTSAVSGCRGAAGQRLGESGTPWPALCFRKGALCP